MLKTHEKFHSENGKRLVLIVDDEEINRELLNLVLKDDYETIFAADGESALKIIREKGELLSLILLDLLMPGMHGLDLIKILKNDQNLKNIPIIVMTADQEAEVASLQLGASDFIPKPYPTKEVILTRVVRSIELSEDRDIITSTERDHLTGLYNREYFYRYAEQFDQHHKDMDMDAIVVDVYHFHMINERYGKAYGDEVLRRIGEKVREMVRDSGGIVCRREADTFLVYCPHREDYYDILENASIGLAGGNVSSNRVRLRMGVYAHVDKSIEVERRFDRAKMASDTIRTSFLKSIALYDNQLHESEIYAERLLEDFHDAIKNREFVVFYQPKFDIRAEIPVLASAEALVRWQHPELGLVSPGVFIPLFEDNGLIQELDNYVWHVTAAQIRDWKNRFGITVPISVNVSRIDMYDPNLIQTFQSILEEYDLSADELLLEITESAYTQDSEQIISVVNQLRELGFRIEMDDFGTGYSSLNMISSLPIDALKLDMKFIRNAFQDGRDTRLIEVIVDIADYLNVPVIAEGVETEEQLETLKLLQVDLVQGFYFSKPVPPSEYEAFIIASKEGLAEETANREGYKLEQTIGKTSFSSSVVHALASGFEVIYYVNTKNGKYVQFSTQGKYEDLQIERSGRDFFADTQKNIPKVIYAEDQDRVSLSLQKEALLAKLIGGRSFSMTYRLTQEGRPVYYNLRAVNADINDDHHIVIGVASIENQIGRDLGEGLSGKDSITYESVALALAADYFSIYYVDMETDHFIEFSAHDEYDELGIEKRGEEFFALSRKNILRVVHPDDHDMILASFTKEKLLAEMDKTGTFTLNYRLMFGDEAQYVSMKATHISDKKHIVIGINNIDAQMRRERELHVVREIANRDALTGVKSKHAYDESALKINSEIKNGSSSPFAIAFCDVNGLKTVNDTKGHQAGDKLILEAARVICDIFKHSPVYRIGGDEFVAILRGSDYENRQMLVEKMIEKSAEGLESGGVIIACGSAAWNADQDKTIEEVFKRADEAMYINKTTLKQMN